MEMPAALIAPRIARGLLPHVPATRTRVHSAGNPDGLGARGTSVLAPVAMKRHRTWNLTPLQAGRTAVCVYLHPKPRKIKKANKGPASAGHALDDW